MPSNLQFSNEARESIAHELRPDLEKSAHNLIVEGFRLWESKRFNRFGDHEGHFNIRMVCCMQHIQRKRDLPFRICDEVKTRDEDVLEGKANPAQSPQIDIKIISWTRASDEAFLTVECKRLKRKRLPRCYVIEGIERFVQGRYGAKTRIGAMIGYVLEGTPEEMVGLINVYANNIFGPEHVLKLTDSVEWLESVYSSQHHRESAPSPIILTHFFFCSDIESYPLT